MPDIFSDGFIWESSSLIWKAVRSQRRFYWVTSIVLAVSLQLWMQTKTVAQRRRRQSLLLSPVKYVELWHSVCEMLVYVVCPFYLKSCFLTTFQNGMRTHCPFHALNMTNKQNYNLSKFCLSVKFQQASLPIHDLLDMQVQISICNVLKFSMATLCY